MTTLNLTTDHTNIEIKEFTLSFLLAGLLLDIPKKYIIK